MFYKWPQGFIHSQMFQAELYAIFLDLFKHFFFFTICCTYSISWARKPGVSFSSVHPVKPLDYIWGWLHLYSTHMKLFIISPILSTFVLSHMLLLRRKDCSFCLSGQLLSAFVLCLTRPQSYYTTPSHVLQQHSIIFVIFWYFNLSISRHVWHRRLWSPSK